MQLELHLAYIHRQVLQHTPTWRLTSPSEDALETHFIFEGSEVAGPGVGVAVLLSLLAEVSGHIAIDNGLGQNHSLQRVFQDVREISVWTHLLTFLLAFPLSCISAM